MFVSDNSPLIWNGNRNTRVFFQNHALARQPAFDARINSAIDKILFLIGYFFQEFVAFFDVQMAG